MRMKRFRGIVILLSAASVATLAYAATHTNSPLTPFRNTTTRGGYTTDQIFWAYLRTLGTKSTRSIYL
jgi:hypothetical protein